jgi:hypothetical protein
MQSTQRRPRIVTCTALAVGALAVPLLVHGVTVAPASAASSKGCVGGGYRVLGKSGAFEGTVRAPAAGFVVQGRYTRFSVRPRDFAVFNQAFTGAPNVLDQTGGRFTGIYASKVPQHRGLRLTSRISISMEDEELQLTRTGPGLSMKLQAKDCANGGIFQMEPERGDGTRTRIVHRLARGAFYYDNRNFRARLGDFVGSECDNELTGPPSRFCVQVEPRVNIGNNISPDFAVRDSSQVADRVPQPACGPDFTNALGLDEVEDHCGGMSVWDVASGGRMGMVTGEDAVEMANSPTECTEDCQAQNQVRGRLEVLGSQFPVRPAHQLRPRTSTSGLNAPLTR